MAQNYVKFWPAVLKLVRETIYLFNPLCSHFLLCIHLYLQLLHDQVGVVQFDQYKAVFMQTMQAAKTNYVALPSLPPLAGYPLRNW